MTCGCGAGPVVEVIQHSPSFLIDAFTTSPFLTLLVAAPVLLALILFYPILIILTPIKTPPTQNELHFSTYSQSSIPLPTLKDEATIQLSVIIPAYNEKDRLEIMLKDCIHHLETLKNNGKSLCQSSGGSEKIITKGIEGELNEMNGNHSIEMTNEFVGNLTDPFKSYEIILVDDGSKDDTSQIALDFSKKINKERIGEEEIEIRVVRLEKNRGKGGAVRHGIMHSRGAQLLFADADGATTFSDLSTLCKEMSRIITPAGHGIVVGSRAHMVGSDAVVKRSFIRNFLMHSFHLLLSLLLRPPSIPSLTKFLPQFLKSKPNGNRSSLPTQPEIKDTQCGFKLFSRESAKKIFPKSHIERWIFDVELLLLAEMSCMETLSKGKVVERNTKVERNQIGDELLRLPLPIAEIPVEWKEIGGSKIDLLKDSIGMALDLCVIRANYALGRWEKPGSVEVELVER